MDMHILDSCKFVLLGTIITLFCSGYVHGIDAMACALVAGGLGAGRSKAGQEIDLAVGLKLHVDVGSNINKGKNVHFLSSIITPIHKQNQTTKLINPSAAKLFNWNFHPLEVVSR